MAKTYEQRMKDYRNLCINHAQLCTVYVNYEINSERPDIAGGLARDAASWYFKAFPDEREFPDRFSDPAYLKHERNVNRVQRSIRRNVK